MGNYRFVPDIPPQTEYAIRFVHQGWKKLVTNKQLVYFSSIYLITGCFIAIHLWVNNGSFGSGLSAFHSFSGMLLLILTIPLILFFLGAPHGYISIMRKMPKVGLVNAERECPVLISRTPKRNGSTRTELWEFESAGIPFSMWPDYFEGLENALDIGVVYAEPGQDGRKILLTVVNHPGPWPAQLLWNNDLLPSNPSALPLGENRGEKITVDLSKSAHLSISARTGGGKSVLQEHLMLACALRGFQIILIDYKGGVDYAVWNKHIPIYTEDEKVKQVLRSLINEQKRRYSLLHESGDANIDEYNMHHPDKPIVRICLFVDELTECLDKTNASKERKESITEIADALSSLARLSRAAGIHMILAQQRGSADIMPGSVRNNVYKICGQCDANLSLLALGTTDAAKRIPSNAKGRFLTEDGIMFQGYFSKITEEVLSGITFNNDFIDGM